MIRLTSTRALAPLFFLGIALTSACSGDANSPFNGNYLPGGSIKGGTGDGAAATDARPVDGARLDTASGPSSLGGGNGNGSGSGGSGGSGGGTGGTTGGGTGGTIGGGPPKDGGAPDALSMAEQCRQCEINNCQMFVRLSPSGMPIGGGAAVDRYTPCVLGKDKDGNELTVTKGPRTGTPVKALCQEVLNCIRVSGCAKGGDNAVASCLCGNSSTDECRSSTAMQTGPCKDIAQAAAEVDDPGANPAQVSINFFNAAYTAGKATQLIFCDLQRCGAECLGLDGGTTPTAPPPDGGADVPPDMADPIDTSPDAVDAGVDAAPDAVDGGDAGPPLVQSAACLHCAQAGKDDGNQSCKLISGCDGITSGAEDKTLCQKLERCMLDTGCWYKGPTGKPDYCFCGTASGISCTTSPNGPCLAEGMAAAKVAPTDYFNGSVKFFKSVEVVGGQQKVIPSGYAVQLFACEVGAACTDTCKTLVPEGSEKLDGSADVGVDAEPDVQPDLPPDVEPDVQPDVPPDLQPDVQPDMMSLEAPPGPNMCVATCTEGRRGQPLPAGCSAVMGCDNLTGDDRTLCQALLDCLHAHPSCWQDGAPASCYCGTAQGLDCNTAPNGVCVHQAVAAAKVPASDYNNGSIRFFNTNYPSGHATQEVVCEKKCLGEDCAPGNHDAGPDVEDQTGTGGSQGTGGETGTGGSSGTGGNPGTGGDTGSGGSPATGGAPGTGGTPATGGASGTSGSAGTGGGGALCPDLDNNGTSDCTQSLVTNSNFATDISGWMLLSTVTAEWAANGAQGAATGAIYANNTQFIPGGTATVVGGPEQCVPASPGLYKVYAETFIASADGPGSVAIGVLFYQGASCTSLLLSGFQTGTSSATNSWTLLQGTASAPAGTTSMKVRLGLYKSVGQASFKATFDNVLVAPSP